MGPLVPAGWLPGAGWGAVAADDLAVGALDLAGAVGADREGPAQFVQDDVVVPIVLEDGVAAVGAVGDVLGGWQDAAGWSLCLQRRPAWRSAARPRLDALGGVRPLRADPPRQPDRARKTSSTRAAA